MLALTDFRSDSFAHQTVLITGGLSGMGSALANRFTALGASVITAGLSPGGGAALVDDRVQAPLRVVQCDVTSAQDVSQLFAGLSRLHVLINCAGVISREREYDVGTFEHVLGVNLVGAFRCCTAASDLLQASSGCIVNVASLFSMAGSPHAPAYGASKAAIAQLTKSLALALAPRSVRVNAVAPGWVRTTFTAPVQDNAETSRKIIERTPLGRWGEVDDICGPVTFLCSRDARFVTGAVLAVDGGYSAG